ncbi:prephenate dehydrogenase [bacterium BMS3Abin05]|nr:prephenate dehydrogenase [bacterium BMS3Abin05]GBE26578.1 prephenate dehydrogenase [bacterium BMS3Bbin03]
MNLPFRSVGVVGLGQIGGSLAQALREAAPNLFLAGVDVNPDRLRFAQSFLDEAGRDLNILDQTEVVLLATPVRHILKLMHTLAARFPRKFYLDAGSTKAKIMAQAESAGTNFRFVGGHPLAGTEKVGEAGWNKNLFKEKYFFLCEKKNTSSADKQLAETIVRLTGARPVWVQPGQHDLTLAYSSHLPYLLSVLYVIQGEEEQKLDPHFLGTGFKSAARLSGSSAQMTLDMILTNREHALNEITGFAAHLKKLKEIILNGTEEDLEKLFTEGQQLWQKVTADD